LVWQPAAALSLKALSGEGFRAPTFVESYLYAYGGFARGNTDNQPETIRTNELVAVYRFMPETLLQLNVYRNRIRDLLRLVPNAEGYLEYQNQSDETRIDGVEAELRWQLSTELASHLNYSHESSKDGAGEPLLGMARWRFNLGVNYVISDRWNLNLVLHAVGERTRASFDQRAELDGYRVWDLSVGYQPNRNWTWQLSAHNLFDGDQRFADVSAGLTDDFPWEGRSVQLGMRWRP
jgi:outer membrane receptor protein involved in Fe transport